MTLLHQFLEQNLKFSWVNFWCLHQMSCLRDHILYSSYQYQLLDQFPSIKDLSTIAKRLSIPLTGFASLEIFWSKQSLRLWAGSVEMINVFFPFPANVVAKLLLVVVFPTPPLPPTNIHLRVSCYKMFFRLPSNYINL